MNTSTERRRQQFAIKEQFVVLYLGRIHVIKGIDHMVRAVARLHRMGYDIAAVVVGPDEGFGSTVKNIAAQESFEHLYMLPTINGKQKQAVFGASDVLVYAAKVEDFGVVAFEGMLSGVPTVVAANTGCSEVARHLNVGYTVTYGDVDQLVGVLREILGDLATARKEVLAARPRIVSTLNWADIATGVHELYKEICM